MAWWLMTLPGWLKRLMMRDPPTASIEDVVQYYESILMARHSGLAKTCKDRKKNCPRAARAEAVGFTLLDHLADRVEIYEDPSEGGPDFVCYIGDKAFVVEVTSISPHSSAGRSGIENQEDLPGGWFSLITLQLVAAAKRKAPQIEGQPAPRLVMIASEHVASSGLLGPLAIETLLLGDYVGDDFAVEGKGERQECEMEPFFGIRMEVAPASRFVEVSQGP